MPVVFSAIVTLFSNSLNTLNRHAYGFKVENRFAGIVILFTKRMIHVILFPTFHCLILVLYCIICFRCSSFIRHLAEQVSGFSPEAFEPTEQISILRSKAKMDDLLELVQKVFSVPTFFLIIANFVSCYRIIGWNFVTYWEEVRVIHSVLYGATSFICLIGVLWVAGGLPVEVASLKKKYYKKAHLRIIFVTTSKEHRLKQELLEEPEFCFTGWDILPYKRSSILAIIGALLTYTALVFTVK
ncbi:uncharacterized protein TNCV_1291621 [Trichonephila clavipes]|nr:uncharacterized protein TNCV_1291621 [Trichonephila clavipes]